MPINSLVLKIASRCNLNCSYCYMYNLGDETYKGQPKAMSDTVVNHLFQKLKLYIQKENLSNFMFILHGGEPLLLKPDWFENFISKAYQYLPKIKLTFTLQTNGVLFTEEWAKLFEKLNIHVGFSWDGPKDIHNKFRVDHSGKGSYNDVSKGMRIYKEYFGNLGALSVINGETSPDDYYSNVKKLGITDLTLLFPHLHYSMTDEYNKFIYDEKDGNFGKWLISLFDLWWNDTDVNTPKILYFEQLISLIFGEKAGGETYGNSENSVIVIETNGDIETSPSLKTCGNGFTKEGMNVITNTFDDALKSNLIDLFVMSHINLPKKCNGCIINSVCGGGRLGHRYSKINEFDNPSIYCKDISNLIVYVQNKVLEKMSIDNLKESNLVKLTNELVYESQI